MGFDHCVKGGTHPKDGLTTYTIYPILSILSIDSIICGLLLSQGQFQPLTWLSNCFYDSGVNQN